jgi:hypothetical protein
MIVLSVVTLFIFLFFLVLYFSPYIPVFTMLIPFYVFFGFIVHTLLTPLLISTPVSVFPVVKL